jgi:hypothetical protein
LNMRQRRKQRAGKFQETLCSLCFLLFK